MNVQQHEKEVYLYINLWKQLNPLPTNQHLIQGSVFLGGKYSMYQM